MKENVSCVGKKVKCLNKLLNHKGYKVNWLVSVSFHSDYLTLLILWLIIYLSVKYTVIKLSVRPSKCEYQVIQALGVVTIRI